LSKVSPSAPPVILQELGKYKQNAPRPVCLQAARPGILE
jgi:hypothetical protein